MLPQQLHAQVVSFGTEFEREEISETSASLMDRMEKTLDHLEEYEKI